MEIIKKEGAANIFNFCPDIEEKAFDQMSVLSRLPFVKHCALMPDAHLGMNMPIGGVIACDNAVVMDAVGVDIGCGMGALKTTLHKSDLDDVDVRKKLLNSLERGIPVGFNHNTQTRLNTLKNQYESNYKYIVDKFIGEEAEKYNPIGRDTNLAKTFFSQLGTLGGGNHFLEVQYDEDDNVWVMIHSGSRNMGKKIGDYFNEVAKELNEKWHSVSKDIHFLPADSTEGQAYLGWMNFGLRFAYLNRKVMLDEVKRCLEHQFPTVKFVTKEMFEGLSDNIINIHHNFVAQEHHMGKDYWVHRKGATLARGKTVGIIPGSMGTHSYIVQGLGNMQSLCSCSHGAGRRMGRRDFCRRMKHSHDQIEKSLEDVVHSKFTTFERGKDKGMLDVSEAPAAYKDIEEVMSNQEELTRPIVTLSPMLSMKG